MEMDWSSGVLLLPPPLSCCWCGTQLVRQYRYKWDGKHDPAVDFHPVQPRPTQQPIDEKRVTTRYLRLVEGSQEGIPQLMVSESLHGTKNKAHMYDNTRPDGYT